MAQKRCTWINKARYVKRTLRCEERAIHNLLVPGNRFGKPVTWVCQDHLDQFVVLHPRGVDHDAY